MEVGQLVTEWKPGIKWKPGRINWWKNQGQNSEVNEVGPRRK